MRRFQYSMLHMLVPDSSSDGIDLAAFAADQLVELEAVARFSLAL